MAYCQAALIIRAKSCWWLINTCVERQTTSTKFFYSVATGTLFCLFHMENKPLPKNMKVLKGSIAGGKKNPKNKTLWHASTCLLLMCYVFLWFYFHACHQVWNQQKVAYMVGSEGYCIWLMFYNIGMFASSFLESIQRRFKFPDNSFLKYQYHWITHTKSWNNNPNWNFKRLVNKIHVHNVCMNCCC